jgi:hypothetical protein
MQSPTTTCFVVQQTGTTRTISNALRHSRDGYKADNDRIFQGTGSLDRDAAIWHQLQQGSRTTILHNQQVYQDSYLQIIFSSRASPSTILSMRRRPKQYASGWAWTASKSGCVLRQQSLLHYTATEELEQATKSIEWAHLDVIAT